MSRSRAGAFFVFAPALLDAYFSLFQLSDDETLVSRAWLKYRVTREIEASGSTRGGGQIK